MPSATCDECGSWIDASNHRWPGFCSPGFRDDDRNRRDAAASALAQRRAAARRRRQATLARRDYVT